MRGAVKNRLPEAQAEMHLQIESKDKLALLAVIDSLLDAPLPPDWQTQASLGREGDDYWFTADFSGPEPSVPQGSTA